MAAIGYNMKIRKLEKELEKRKEELRKEVEAEFVRQKQIELRKEIYAELVVGNEMSKLEVDFVPRNELGVILLFGRYHDYLGFQILDIHSISPDCLAKKDGEQVRIEFEFTSSNFITHHHTLEDCDLVVCWKKDVELPIEVLELSSHLVHFIKNVGGEHRTKGRLRKVKDAKVEKIETVEEREAREKKVEELEEVIKLIEG